jgi:hypothetical protein
MLIHRRDTDTQGKRIGLLADCALEVIELAHEMIKFTFVNDQIPILRLSVSLW